jgi:hypothetical protein
MFFVMRQVQGATTVPYGAPAGAFVLGMSIVSGVTPVVDPGVLPRALCRTAPPGGLCPCVISRGPGRTRGRIKTDVPIVERGGILIWLILQSGFLKI